MTADDRDPQDRGAEDRAAEVPPADAPTTSAAQEPADEVAPPADAQEADERPTAATAAAPEQDAAAGDDGADAPQRDAAHDDATDAHPATAPVGPFATLGTTPEARAAREEGPKGRDAVHPVVPARVAVAGSAPARRHSPFRDWTWGDTGRVAALLAGALLFLVPVALLLGQRGQDAAVAARQAQEYTPPPVALAGSSQKKTGPVITIVADESALAAAPGVTASQRWPALLGQSLDSTVDLIGVTGGGYATTGEDGVTFLNAAADVASDTDVVLFVGGANDAAASAGSLSRAATNAFSAAGEQAPGVAVGVVGPLVSDGASAARLSALRSVLASAATSTGVRWVDPASASWLPTPRASAGALTAADERAIATRLEALVKRLAA